MKQETHKMAVHWLQRTLSLTPLGPLSILSSLERLEGHLANLLNFFFSES